MNFIRCIKISTTILSPVHFYKGEEECVVFRISAITEKMVILVELECGVCVRWRTLMLSRAGAIILCLDSE